ncbi:hypothetical protein Ccrd_008296, partial [Cynara cardunculus var. scolymus]
MDEPESSCLRASFCEFAPLMLMADNVAAAAASLRMLWVYLRTYALDQMVQAASSSTGLRTIKRVEQFLQELKVSYYPLCIYGCDIFYLRNSVYFLANILYLMNTVRGIEHGFNSFKLHLLQFQQVNLKPKVPTKAVCVEHLELRKEIFTLLNLQKFYKIRRKVHLIMKVHILKHQTRQRSLSPLKDDYEIGLQHGMDQDRTSNSDLKEPTLAIVDSKFEGGAIEELQNAFGGIVQAPMCRPWDREDLLKRLATFKSMTWFAKLE